MSEARLVNRAVSLTTACRCHGVPLHVGPEPTLRRGIQRLVGGVISAESKDVFFGGLLVARLAYKMQILLYQLYQVSGACVHVPSCTPYQVGLSSTYLARLARVSKLGRVAPL